jgi:hypothetical protein
VVRSHGAGPGCRVRVSASGLGPFRRGSSPCIPTPDVGVLDAYPLCKRDLLGSIPRFGSERPADILPMRRVGGRRGTVRKTRHWWLVPPVLFAVVVAAFMGVGFIESLDRPAQMLRWTNEVRVSRGQRGLIADDAIEVYSKSHSIRMAAAGTLFHSTDTQLRLLCPAQYAGEVVGQSGSDGGPRDVFLAFMRSDTHRHILLSGHYRVAGFGVVQIEGRWWVTGVLCSAGASTTTFKLATSE